MTVQRDLAFGRYSLSSIGVFNDSGAIFERFYTLDYFFFNFKILHKFKKPYYFR